MTYIDKIAYSLLVLFLRLYELEPLPEESWEYWEYGSHIVWTVPANVRPDRNVPSFYDQLSCAWWEYIEHFNDFPGTVVFQPYALEEYGTNVVYVSVYQ